MGDLLFHAYTGMPDASGAPPMPTPAPQGSYTHPTPESFQGMFPGSPGALIMPGHMNRHPGCPWCSGDAHISVCVPPGESLDAAPMTSGTFDAVVTMNYVRMSAHQIPGIPPPIQVDYCNSPIKNFEFLLLLLCTFKYKKIALC